MDRLKNFTTSTAPENQMITSNNVAIMNFKSENASSKLLDLKFYRPTKDSAKEDLSHVSYGSNNVDVEPVFVVKLMLRNAKPATFKAL